LNLVASSADDWIAGNNIFSGMITLYIFMWDFVFSVDSENVNFFQNFALERCIVLLCGGGTEIIIFSHEHIV